MIMSFFSVCCFILYSFLNYIINLSAVWFPCYKFYKCMYMIEKVKNKNILCVIVRKKKLNKNIFHKCLFRFKFKRSERTHIIISTLTLRKMHYSSKEFQTIFFLFPPWSIFKMIFSSFHCDFFNIRILQYI